MTAKLLRFKKIHYYIIPLVALVVWWGMLIAMLSAWSLQGKPMYDFMHGKTQNPVYISDIGATNLQPLFIACVGFQMIFFVGTLVMEYVLRQKKKLQPYVSKKQPYFAMISIIFAILGQLGILFVAIFKTSKYKTVHLSMVVVFIICEFFACVFNFFNSFIFGNFPQRLNPNHEKVIFGKHRWANMYMVSFFCKLVWLMAALAFAILFGYNMRKKQRSISACFEWTISFWYGMLLVFWAIDLFPSAVKHWEVHHAEKVGEEFIDHHQEPITEDGDHSEKLVDSSGASNEPDVPQPPPALHQV